MKYLLSIFAGLIFSTQAMAWQGFNMDTGTVIFVDTAGQKDIKVGNVKYFDYDDGTEKLGYINMYDQTLCLILD